MEFATDILIEVRDAVFGYGGRAVVRVEHLQLARGQCLGIFGPNGSGKTTLVRGITGLLPPMAGQVLAQTHPGWDTISLSGCIIAAQLVMVAIAWAVGKAMGAGYGRKTIFLVALAVLPVRGILFSFTANPIGVIAIQLLDGVAAGIFGVIAIVIAADVTRGTGRFNLAQGLVALSIGVGAGLSNLVAGYLVQWFGYPAGFLSLAVIAACALVFFALFMPETRDMRGRRAARTPAPAGATA